METFVEFVRRKECDYEAPTERAGKVMRRLHAIMGLSTEANELLDGLKKVLMYGKEIDEDNELEELSDIWFFFNMLADECGYTIEEIELANRRKLDERYKGDFTEEEALNRKSKEEEIRAMKGETND